MNCEINVACLMCGKSYVINEQHKDYKRLATHTKSIYICDKCNHKVRFETKESNKEIKPI